MQDQPELSGEPSLEGRPKAEARSVEDLVDEARKGRIRIPRFQRGLQWAPKDARLLFDSIYRGYPIGTLLFWSTKGGAEIVHFGPVAIEANERSDAWWVVDGQQRLTSLVRVLVDSKPDAFSLWFDLDEEKFVQASAVKKDAARFLPLTEVLDTERLHDWVSRHDLAPERRRLAFRLNKRVREYAVPAYIVETSDEEVLRRIFERTNASGKALSRADVFNALHGARGSSEPADFKAVAGSLVNLGFGAVDEDILHRALLAIHNIDPVGGKVPARLRDAPLAFARTARAIRAAIVFLMGQVGVPHYALLPYKQPLVPLATFFDRHPTPSARSRELLSRWIWRGAWSGLHRGDAVSTRATVGAISEDEDTSVQALLATLATKSEPPLSDLPAYNFRHARTKLDLLALLSLGPRHLVTGAPLAPSLIFDADVTIQVITGMELAGTIASRIIHPKLPKLRAALARADATVRASHAISDQAREALVVDGSELGFLAHRADDVAGLSQSFLRARAKWEESDRPPLKALHVDD